MKKWIGALCSGLAGVLTLVFLAIPALTVDLGKEFKYSGWKLLTDSDLGKADFTAVTWYRIFAWILVVLAIVMIVVAVLQVLANLNIVKMPAILNTVANYALIGLVIVSVLALVASFGIRADWINFFKEPGMPKEIIKEIKEAFSIGAGLWIVAIVNTILAVVDIVMSKLLSEEGSAKSGNTKAYRLPAFLLCFFLGALGIHRFYAGKVGTGLLYLFTGGLFGIGVFVDFIMIICGSFTDKAGNKIVRWTEN